MTERRSGGLEKVKGLEEEREVWKRDGRSGRKQYGKRRVLSGKGMDRMENILEGGKGCSGRGKGIILEEGKGLSGIGKESSGGKG